MFTQKVNFLAKYLEFANILFRKISYDPTKIDKN